MPYAICELEPIGVDAELESNGRVYWYCSPEHAVEDSSIPEPHSEPFESDDCADGTVCEVCSKLV